MNVSLNMDEKNIFEKNISFKSNPCNTETLCLVNDVETLNPKALLLTPELTHTKVNTAYLQVLLEANISKKTCVTL